MEDYFAFFSILDWIMWNGALFCVSWIVVTNKLSDEKHGIEYSILAFLCIMMLYGLENEAQYDVLNDKLDRITTHIGIEDE